MLSLRSCCCARPRAAHCARRLPPRGQGRIDARGKWRRSAEPKRDHGAAVDTTGGADEGSAKRPVAEERFGGDRVRRYWQDEATGELRVEEAPVAAGAGRGASAGLAVADFVLPAGYPNSVSDDYLEYMLWQFPTHVTGWICSTLVTSSLFKAVGLADGGGTYAAAATATIKWVTKDGLGAVGQFVVGGRFGSIFDEDPKQWRMYADLIGSAGSVFELLTPLAPDQFLLLASLGHLTKAVAKGLKDPSFRVIQNHFAVFDNVGDVSAKEEVWDVAAKLVGLAIAVLILSWPALGLSTSYAKLVLTWICIRALHLLLRHQSLSVVQLSTINYKRAAILIQAHVEGRGPLPGVPECNRNEQLLIPWQMMSPRIWVGCSLQDILDLCSSDPSPPRIDELLRLYSDEHYILVVSGLEARVLMKQGASSASILRSLWQAYWLFSRPSATSGNYIGRLRASLDALERNFASFKTELKASGWDADRIAIKVPSVSPVFLQSP
ncbi:hypothetical protein MPTK1_7g07710 [Marchantia polymorpha subsp. ruderalis]|uniref:Uncharacterized protein n=2 Tax=Marchantia polymorpha TaxID=3197 RepID=A0AAF6BX65_MARPO|nr:hypothetical protein MARPO_0076s0023 [Marchantia polymorpha]BBN16599.1 hypothetical protein Mp_7g07710 [Marchantia polymorpha subsp. ruderalis]|eukprot:PTQ34778.1 hypothetical protein MARPO_0076s0023 [Marchantia polymorpha]